MSIFNRNPLIQMDFFLKLTYCSTSNPFALKAQTTLNAQFYRFLWLSMMSEIIIKAHKLRL